MGQVTLRMREERQTATHCDVLFMVQDSGIGVSPDAIPILFKPFSQADTSTARRFGGSGLGLTISKNVRGHLRCVHEYILFKKMLQ
jgi:signal transduction histidine kinase